MCMKVESLWQKIGSYWFYSGISMREMSIVNKEKKNTICVVRTWTGGVSLVGR